MSFKGIVTRKEKDTGVTLEAKVVTPSKKKAAKHRVKVKIKKTGLTDYECCVLDQNTIRTKITTRQDLTALKEDIAFTYSGEHGTVIEYVIENAGSNKLTDYLDSNGKIIKRPVYGKDSTTGYISMTVKKGVEAINTRIPVTIEKITAQEALQSLVITESTLWNSIKGKNGNYTEDDTSGHKNIFYNLNLIKTSDELQTSDKLAVEALTSTPITFTWTIVDNAYARNSALITQSRVADDGTVFIPTYQDACALIDTGTVDAVLVEGTTAYIKRVRIGELTIRATMKLDTETRDIVFNCSTCSKYITNTEVNAFASSLINIICRDTNDKFAYRTMNESTTNMLTIPLSASTGLSLGLVCDTTPTNEYAIPELKLGIGQVDYTFTHRICEYQTTADYDDTGNIFLSGIEYNGSISGETEINLSKRWPISIDSAAVKLLTDNKKKKFTIETTINTSRYTSGTSSSVGATIQTKLYCHIELNDSLI